MTQVPHFGRVLTAMITPFTVNGELDVNEAVKLAKWLQEQGNDGLVVTGTTGEASTLTDAEKIALWEAVAQAVTIPVIASGGVSSMADLTALRDTKIIAGAISGRALYDGAIDLAAALKALRA